MVSFAQKLASLEVFVEVERFKFGAIVKHEARARLVHEVLIARDLARGVGHEGLRLHSVDLEWPSATRVAQATVQSSSIVAAQKTAKRSRIVPSSSF